MADRTTLTSLFTSTAATMAPKKNTPAAKEEAHGYEFGGPIGAALISFGLPIGCYAFAFLCNDVTGCPAPSLLSPSKLFTPPAFSMQSGWEHALDTLKKDVGWPGLAGLVNTQAVVGTFAWYGLSLLLNVILPAQEVDGVELTTGGRLKYRFNAFLSAVTIMVILAAGTWVRGPEFSVWTFVDRNYIQILTTNILIAYALATFVYVKSFGVKKGNKDKRELAAGGHSGNLIYDWFIGRELNPRVTLPFLGEIDIKSWMELRPGMLGWVLLDLAFMAKQYRSYGYVTDSMLMVTISQAIYVFDALWMEPAILTTIDITTDGFGFMLAFGDLVWVPFIYSLQARYLSVHPIVLGPLYVVGILGVQLLGYYIFRASNNEKNRFRTNPDDPKVAHLKYIETASGSKLLTSGWWGTARHINYLGDWLMSWAYCLPTLAAGYKLVPSILHPGTRLVSTDGMAGWATPITYFYMLYFAILLIHREMRDEEKCRRKYGADWEKYCQQVRYRILPGIY
ncbi:Delta(14)-sterol reductase [Acrodontium crateriforme]|uniref:Delta(14)-sterol reductase n=1 Tax=Acrodontium crateriforme TaxID=150365 RepID=A0AAQ3R7K8_9PEZI|nr:Delta(14)-sterol reductase [Acrodontium crateriforme]